MSRLQWAHEIASYCQSLEINDKLDPWSQHENLELYVVDLQFDHQLTRAQRRAMRSLRKLAAFKPQPKQHQRTKSQHPRLRSDSFLSRYAFRRHGTQLEQYDAPVPGSFLLPGKTKVRLRWPYHVTIRYNLPDMWARWVTVTEPGRSFMGPAAIKRSRMKSRARLQDPTLEREARIETIKRKNAEPRWDREDREWYCGRSGSWRVRFDEFSREDECDDDHDHWDDDDRGDYCDQRSDSEIVEDCTEQLMQIAASEAPRMLLRLRAVLLELAREVTEYKPIDRPLRQHVILDARGKIGRDRVWYAWRRSEIDWLRGVPGECE